MAESTGPNRAWMSVEYGGYSQGKLMKFFVGGDTPEDVLEQFAAVFGQEATNDATAKFLNIMTEDTTKNAIGNLQSAGMVESGPRCKHGPRTRREGRNSRGPWVGYFCPTPQGTPDQCKPEFE